MSHLVPTLHTSSQNSFRPRSCLALIDKGLSSWTMSHCIDLMTYNKLLKMLDTSTSICHYIVHLSMLQNGYLDTPKAMPNKMISKIIEHDQVTLNDDVQTVMTNMVQGWIREVNRNFGREKDQENLMHDVLLFMKYT